MSKRIGLGKGLGAFFGEDYEIEPQKERSVVKEKATVKKTQNQGKDEKKENPDSEVKKENKENKNNNKEKDDNNIKKVITSNSHNKVNEIENGSDIQILKDLEKINDADSAELKIDKERINEAEQTNDIALEQLEDLKRDKKIENEKHTNENNKSENKTIENSGKEKIKIVEVEKEKYLNISLIEPNRSQPRKMFDEEQLNELADSVREYGVLQPLLVQKKGEYYEIIAGERRWRAAKLAGLKEVPVVVREYSKQRTMEIALIENVQRADLNPIEEAKAYQILVQEFGLKQEDVATRVSKNRATITNSMRLLKLDERIQNMLIQNKISGGHARTLLALEDKEQQYLVANKIIENQLSVREVEKLVKKLTTPVEAKKKNSNEDNEKDRDLSVFYHDLEDKLKMVMGTKVTINKKDKNKGRIEIEYYSPAELERLIELLQSINN